jgi:hypothetical protein
MIVSQAPYWLNAPDEPFGSTYSFTGVIISKSQLGVAVAFDMVSQ